MADIFISYSRKDANYALRLAESLQTLGHSIWVDKSGIGAGETWTSEIVEGIKGCRTFILLISPSSVNSHNCAKELHLATEKQKHILPVVLEATMLPPSFEYPLAGLQRVPVTDMPAIVRALKRMSLRDTLLRDVDEPHEQEHDKIKRLAVLPFEDRSPSHDNEWFADGLADELTSMLNKLEQVFVTDKQTAREYKRSMLTAKQIAHELAVRFILHGSVMKADAKIRVSADLIDTHTGNTLWDERFTGTMEDIFEIQESIARQIADGLKIHLSPEEQEKIALMPTRNAEAYELNLRAREYFIRHTKTDFEYAISLLQEAVALDPNYANAYLNIGNLHMAIYMLYDRKQEHLNDAEIMLRKSLELDPMPIIANLTLARFLFITGKGEEANAVAKKAEDRLTDNAAEFIHTAQYYHFTGDILSSARMIEKALALDPDINMTAYFNLLSEYYHAGDIDAVQKTAERALPRFNKYLRTHPDDHTQRVHYVWALEFCGKIDDAIREADIAIASGMNEGRNLYNLGCSFVRIGKHERALDLLERAVDSGFSYRELFEADEFNAIRDSTRFRDLLAKLETPKRNPN